MIGFESEDVYLRRLLASAPPDEESPEPRSDCERLRATFKKSRRAQ
jgi:hypothetical protein